MCRLWMKLTVCSCLLLGLWGFWPTCLAQSAATSNRNVAALLTVKGAIGPAFEDYIARGLEQAQKWRARVVILKLDTPGGLSKSMRLIIQNILQSPIPVITYVAPSGARAASAGTYILYASHIAAMAPGTNLGAATPVSMGAPGPAGGNKKEQKDQNKQKSASELKALNDAKAYIRSLAQLRGRNVKWAESAVSKAESLSASEALAKNVINVIARSVDDLLNQVNGKTVMVDNNQVVLNTKGLMLQRVKMDWRTRFLAIITDPSVAYILLIVGIYGIFFEFMNPGFVLPGVVGAISLLVALYALQLLPISYAGLGLILLGIGFLVAEAFVPSFGVLGIGGVVAFTIGSIMLIKTQAVGFTIPIQLILAVAITTALFFIGVMQLVFRSRRRKVVSGQEGMIGRIGYIKKDNQQTWVKVEGELWRCHSDEDLKDGEQVKVTEIKNLVLRVKKNC